MREVLTHGQSTNPGQRTSPGEGKGTKTHHQGNKGNKGANTAVRNVN